MEAFCLPFPGVKSNLISFNSFLAFLCNKKDNSLRHTAKKKKAKGRKTKQNKTKRPEPALFEGKTGSRFFNHMFLKLKGLQFDRKRTFVIL